VALGLPLLAGGRGGLGVFFGPTLGFLIGWPLGAFVAGLLMKYLERLSVFAAAATAASVGGIVVVYLVGIPVLAVMADMPIQSAAMGSMVFIPGDIVKVIICALVARTIWQLQPDSLMSRA
jgi:biotin transport system substrate-specific component